MNSYTASNGVGLTITRDRTVRWRPGIPANLVSSALREYFQAERDEELGRWRDPEEPDYVAYPRPDLDDGDGRCVLVLDELSGATRTDWEQIALPGPADRYFTAHPLPEPEIALTVAAPHLRAGIADEILDDTPGSPLTRGYQRLMDPKPGEHPVRTWEAAVRVMLDTLLEGGTE